MWSWTFEASDAEAAYAARNEFTHVLRDNGMSDNEVENAHVVFGELVGNVVRYAPGTIRKALDRTSTSPVLHVLDDGSGFEYNRALPSDVMAESGRGLYVVSHLTKELSITRRRGAGSHTRAVLCGNLRKQ